MVSSCTWLAAAAPDSAVLDNRGCILQLVQPAACSLSRLLLSKLCLSHEASCSPAILGLGPRQLVSFLSSVFVYNSVCSQPKNMPWSLILERPVWHWSPFPSPYLTSRHNFFPFPCILFLTVHWPLKTRVHSHLHHGPTAVLPALRAV